MASRKGRPNRIGAEVKENVIAVFNRLGGTHAMAEWAKKHMGEFYKLYARLIPTESHIDVTRRQEARELSTEELMAIAARALPAQEGLSAAKEQPNQTELH